MKSTIFFIQFFLLTSTLSFSQDFEGQITYGNNYRSNIENISDLQLTAMMGEIQEFYIKNGNYKSILSGNYLLWQLYRNKENKLYNKFAQSLAIMWNDCKENSDSIISTIINKNVVEILGYRCDELIVRSTSGVQKYYYNEKIKADDKLFIFHKYSNWDKVVLLTKSLPLKTIIENNQYSFESIAIKIKEYNLEDSMFILPTDAVLEKSLY